MGLRRLYCYQHQAAVLGLLESKAATSRKEWLMGARVCRKSQMLWLAKSFVYIGLMK